MWRAVMVAVVIGSSAVAWAAPGPAPAPAHPGPHAAPKKMTFRQLGVGEFSNTAHRETYVMTLVGDDVTLVELEESSTDVFNIAAYDRGEAHWTRDAQRTYHGTRHDAQLVLLTSDGDGAPIEWSCKSQRVDVSLAGAYRVPAWIAKDDGHHHHRDPDETHDCGEPGVWKPAGTQHIDALVCLPVIEDGPNLTDDDRLIFAAAPGVEWIYENDGCDMQGGGFRRAKR